MSRRLWWDALRRGVSNGSIWHSLHRARTMQYIRCLCVLRCSHIRVLHGNFVRPVCSRVSVGSLLLGVPHGQWISVQ